MELIEGFGINALQWQQQGQHWMKALTVISFTTPLPQFGLKASHWQKTGEAVVVISVGSFSSVTSTAVKQIQL